MISFMINLVLLSRILVRALRNDPEFRSLALLLLVVIFIGVGFYWAHEDWSFVDSVYFCVVTVSTVGYGDLAPTTAVSKVFTICYILLGIGLFIPFVGKVLSFWIEDRAERQEKRHERKEQHRKAREAVSSKSMA